MVEPFRNMDRWLGDGGMPLLGALGVNLETYGVDGEDLGWTTGTFVPTELACNTRGIVQAGVHAVVLDAVINFSINAALRGRDTARATLEIKTETMRPAAGGQTYAVRGDVVRMAKQVAYGEGELRDGAGELVARATATFLLHRSDG